MPALIYPTKNNVKIFGNTASDKTIVFGHGFGIDQTSWNAVQSAFIDNYKIITYDNVGAGKSSPDAYSQLKYSSLQSYADDIIDFSDDLYLRDAIFVGHSISGIAGLLASKKAPELFSKHVFINTSPRYLNDLGYVGGFDQSDLHLIFEAMETDYQTWVSGFAPVIMANSDKPKLTHDFVRTLSTLRPEIALAVAKAIFLSDYRKDLNGFTKKSLIIQSNDDMIVPIEVGKYLNASLQDSQLRIINAEGHFPHISSPDEVIRAIISFI